MDIKSQILLGSQKNVNSVNVDSYGKIKLNVSEAQIIEFNINDVVNSTDEFDAEREANQIYRIYGRIEYLSLLNGLKNNYDILEDFFNPQYGNNSKSILNSFKFYIVAPHSATTYVKITGTNKYMRSFIVLSDEDNFEIYNAGFTNNVYGEQVYAFNFKLDFNVDNYYDNFGFPLTELFLYAQYIKSSITGQETMYYTKWSSSTGLPTKLVLNTKTLTIGDDVENNSVNDINDIIEYIPEEYYQNQVSGQTFFIRTKYTNPDTQYLEWSYNPFIPLRLRYLDSVVSTAKLPEIIENNTSLEIYPSNNPNQKIVITKTLKQSITTTLSTITNWDIQTFPYSFLNFDFTTGRFFFTVAGEYVLNLTTQIYLPYDTDKYIAKTQFKKTLSASIISGTTRKYRISDAVQGTNFNYFFAAGEQVTIETQLIPNPDERKVEIIPDYALMLKNMGKYVWRNILPQGYTDPLSSEGVDYPFFNGKRYLFAPIILDVPPNLSTEAWKTHSNTITVFNSISYSKNATEINLEPLDDNQLNNIGKPCQ